MTTFTAQPDETAGSDTYINSGDPTTNRDSSADLFVGAGVGEVYRTLLKFDLSDLPATAVLSSVILTLNANTAAVATGFTLGVCRLKRAWVETEATYNIYSTGNSWQTAGGFGANDCEQAAIGTLVLAAAEGTGAKAITLNVVSKAALDLGNGWLLKSTNEAVLDAIVFDSARNGTAANRPKLVAEYTIPAAASNTTFTRGRRRGRRYRV